MPPRRIANGIDRNRLALVLAVLGRHGGIGVGSADVFVNVAGGVRVDEPGADLGRAVASAARGVVLSARRRARGGRHGDDGGATALPVACFGELGLTGELRSVGHADRRLAEARKFGLHPVVAPPEHATLKAALRAVLPRGDAGARGPRAAAA